MNPKKSSAEEAFKEGENEGRAEERARIRGELLAWHESAGMNGVPSIGRRDLLEILDRICPGEDPETECFT